MSGLIDLLNIFDAVKSLTGINACIYDFNKFLTYESGAFQKNLSGHYCAFCRSVRSLPGGRNACIKSDTIDAVMLAKSYNKPFFNTCHIGLTELIIPMFYSDNLIGMVFLGQCIITGETSFSNISKKLDNHNIDIDKFFKLYKKLPAIEKKQVSDIGKLVDSALKQLIIEHGEKIINLQYEDETTALVTRAVEYIRNSYMLSISSKDISNYLHINQSYLSRIFKRKTGLTLLDYITKIRMDNAKNLLGNTKIPISNIAFNVGYNDQNYFSRHFKQLYGLNPREYRNHYLES